MDYHDFARDAVLHRPLHFTSVEQLEEVLTRDYGFSGYELRQLGAGSFQSHWAMLETNGVELFSDRYNKGFSLVLHPPENMVGLLFGVSASGTLLASGHNIANDRLLLVPEGCATDMTAPPLAGSEALALPTNRLLEIAEVTAPDFQLPEQPAVLSGHVGLLQNLRGAIIDYLAHPWSDPLGEQLDNLVTATILWMANTENPSIHLSAKRAAIAKCAQDYLEVHYLDAVRMEDLCRVTGVGARALQRSFREYFDLTIRQYLKMLRLNAARRSLVAVRGNGTTVADVALQHGFTHLGRFSVDFKDRFGESPSETLGLRPRKQISGSSAD